MAGVKPVGVAKVRKQKLAEAREILKALNFNARQSNEIAGYTFLALLEMIRLKLVRVFQSGGAGAIRVYKRARPMDAPHPIGDPQNL